MTLAQDHQPEPVERGHGEPPRAAAEQRRQPLAHLLGGPAGEGQGQAGLGGHALLRHGRREAVGQRARLAGARSRDDHQRRGGGRGGPLLRIEPVQQRAARGCSRGTPIRNAPGGFATLARLILRATRGGGALVGRCRCGRLVAWLVARLAGRGNGVGQGAGRDVEQRGRAPVEFPRPEQPDDPVLAVVAGLFMRRAGPQPRDGLGEQAAAVRLSPAVGTVSRMASSGPSVATSRAHLGVDLLALGPGAQQFGHHVRQGDQVDGVGRGVRPVTLHPVGQFRYPVEYADRQRLPALRAYPLAGGRLSGLKPDPALTVPVQVVTAALGEEIDRALQAGPGPQGLLDRKIIQFNVKCCGLTAKHRR